DGFMLLFERAADGVRCALDIQEELAQEAWPEELGELRVRIGIHTDRLLRSDGPDGRPDYYGPAVNLAARLAEAGHGGQILISAATDDALRSTDPGEFQRRDLGRHRLRGIELPQPLVEIHAPQRAPEQFPPPRTLDATSLPVYLSSFVG